MAAREDDFENRYFDQLDKRFDAIDASIKQNTKATETGFKALGSRVNKLEEKVFPAQHETVKQLPSLWRDPQIIKLLSLVFGFLLLLSYISAVLLGIKVPNIFGSVL